MKKVFFTMMVISAIAFSVNSVKAQRAWEKNSKVLSLGFGVSQFYHLDDYYYYDTRHPHNYYSPTTLQLNLQAEFGIHPYVGLGFTTGIGGRGGLRYDYRGELNIPIAMIVNFHFYQLIADKSTKNIHADKLDLYFGASLGTGVAFAYYYDFTRVVPMAFGGVHFGVRYYFSPTVGVNCEVGWGKSLVNAGMVFKI
jgi:hypothetical protein